MTTPKIITESTRSFRMQSQNWTFRTKNKNKKDNIPSVPPNLCEKNRTQKLKKEDEHTNIRT